MRRVYATARVALLGGIVAACFGVTFLGAAVASRLPVRATLAVDTASLLSADYSRDATQATLPRLGAGVMDAASADEASLSRTSGEPAKTPVPVATAAHPRVGSTTAPQPSARANSHSGTHGDAYAPGGAAYSNLDPCSADTHGSSERAGDPPACGDAGIDARGFAQRPNGDADADAGRNGPANRGGHRTRRGQWQRWRGRQWQRWHGRERERRHGRQRERR